MRKKEIWFGVFKWGIYALLLLLFYMMQTTKGLTVPIFSARPLLILSAALCVSFLEPLVPAGIYAFCAGLLMDYASGTLFGYYAFFFVLIALLFSLLNQFATLPGTLSFLIFGSAAVLLQGHIDFLFRYALFEVSGTGEFYLTRFLPMLVYTLLMTLAAFFLFRAVHRRFTPENEQEVV